MKSIAFYCLVICLLGCYEIPPVKTGLEGKPLPFFNLLLIDSITHFNTKNIPAGKPTVLFFFSPDCPHCRALTKEIVSDMKTFKNVQFYILTSFPFELLKKYYDHYKLKNYSNITVGQDVASYFANYFKATGVPYIAIYSKEKRLKQVLVGKVSTSRIIDAVLK